MAKIELSPWNWFKKSNLANSSIFNENNSLWANANRSINSIFVKSIKDFILSLNFPPRLLKTTIHIKILPVMDISVHEKKYNIEVNLPSIKAKREYKKEQKIVINSELRDRI